MSNRDFNFQEELKKLPDRPGVYIMHDKNDTIIYVGKAVNLNNRVRSYFRTNIGRGPKIDTMVKLIEYFEYIVTDSELEALVLENNLIKEHRPKYNTMLMDDKTYPYIRITAFEDYPRIQFSRRISKDKARYFGPYTDVTSIKQGIDLVNKMFGLRTCNRNMRTPSKPCLNYHLGQCVAPCLGNVSKEEYAQRVKNVIDFLNGSYGTLIKDLTIKMQEASEKMNYEEAIKYRDYIKNIKALSQKQKIEDAALNNKDVIGFYKSGDDVLIQVFFVRNGKMTNREHYHMKAGVNEDDGSILSEFIVQFYQGAPFIPEEILIPDTITDADVLESWLKEKAGKTVRLNMPKLGQKERLVCLASENAKIQLNKDKERIKLEEAKTLGAVRELSELLGISDIDRMEAFDISNTSGFQNVASMVVFENGKPKKSDYRKFKIKSVTGPNDYECMREVITRRFEDYLLKDKGFEKLPDLLLMDGGRGQVNIAESVLSELNINVHVVGMVKDDHHRTRGLFFNNTELGIDRHSEAFKLITRVQDEAHRFAIEYHKSLRTRAQVHSVLDDIEGVGPKRRQQLMKAFDSLEDIQNAAASEIAERAHIPMNAAEKIYNYFNDRRKKE